MAYRRAICPGVGDKHATRPGSGAIESSAELGSGWATIAAGAMQASEAARVADTAAATPAAQRTVSDTSTSAAIVRIFLEQPIAMRL